MKSSTSSIQSCRVSRRFVILLIECFQLLTSQDPPSIVVYTVLPGSLSHSSFKLGSLNTFVETRLPTPPKTLACDARACHQRIELRPDHAGRHVGGARRAGEAAVD